MQMQVEKYVCSVCGKESYDPNEFELCIYCESAMCDGCITYEFVDGLDEPVCKKCQ